MIDAKDARAKARLKFLEVHRQLLSNLINNAVENGKMNMVYGSVPFQLRLPELPEMFEDLIHWLKSFGYSVAWKEVDKDDEGLRQYGLVVSW